MIDNLQYFNNKRLIDNEVYAYLTKLREMEREIPEISSGLDYYKMWLSQYNHNKDSITAKSNVENYVGFICEIRRRFDNALRFVDIEFDRMFENNGKIVLIPMLDFVFDRYNIKTIKKLYKLKQGDLIIGLGALKEVLKKLWR